MNDFRFSCLHCSSTSVYIESDPRVSWEKDKILRCYICGWSLYGKDAVEGAIKKQYEAHQKLAAEEAAKEAARRAITALPTDWEDLHTMKQEARKRRGLCAHLGCDSPPRDNSMYCSRKCCVKNAHYKERKRKEDAISRASSKAA